MTDAPARRLAARLRRHGLDAPARLLADAHRPIAPLLSDLGAAIGPMIGALAGPRRGSVQRFLADERALDELLVELDATGEARAEPD